MKLTGKKFLVISLIFFVINVRADELSFSAFEAVGGNHNIEVTAFSDCLIARNDTFLLLTGCNSNSISGNALINDSDAEDHEIIVEFVRTPNKETMSMDNQGNFTFYNPVGFFGTISFAYKICEKGNISNYAEASVVIIIKNDNDCDGVPDDLDIDNDNDGILDIDDGIDLDTDRDGIFNYLDIDSDGDGIVDNIEAQAENMYIKPLCTDQNKDGWDDAYDTKSGGKYFKPADSDLDGTPDFLDNDSDNDNISDLIEAHEINLVINPHSCDIDKDGLDDAYDNVQNWWNELCNTLGSNTPLPDTNKNGTRDWRDKFRNKSINGLDNNLSGPGMYFTIYPNPTVRYFRINNSFFEDVEVIDFEIYNLEGKLLVSQKDVSINSEIDAGGIDPGNYIIRIKSSVKTVVNRLVISQ